MHIYVPNVNAQCMQLAVKLGKVMQLNVQKIQQNSLFTDSRNCN